MLDFAIRPSSYPDIRASSLLCKSDSAVDAYSDFLRDPILSIQDFPNDDFSVTESESTDLTWIANVENDALSTASAQASEEWLLLEKDPLDLEEALEQLSQSLDKSFKAWLLAKEHLVLKQKTLKTKELFLETQKLVAEASVIDENTISSELRALQTRITSLLENIQRVKVEVPDDSAAFLFMDRLILTASVLLGFLWPLVSTYLIGIATWFVIWAPTAAAALFVSVKLYQFIYSYAVAPRKAEDKQALAGVHNQLIQAVEGIKVNIDYEVFYKQQDKIDAQGEKIAELQEGIKEIKTALGVGETSTADKGKSPAASQNDEIAQLRKRADSLEEKFEEGIKAAYAAGADDMLTKLIEKRLVSTLPPSTSDPNPNVNPA